MVLFSNMIESLSLGLNIVHGGITIQKDMEGRESGEAFVEFSSKDDIDKALERDRKEIQHRYFMIVILVVMPHCIYVLFIMYVCVWVVCKISVIFLLTGTLKCFVVLILM